MGEIIHDVWCEQVKRAYRGPRTKREYVYVNLSRIQSASDNSSFEPNTDLLTRLSDFTLPDGWTMISNKPNCVSFVRLESWEFNNTRASTELVVSQMETSAIITVKSHGCQSDLASTVLDSLPLKSRICLAIEFIQTSALCCGFILPDEECIEVWQPHVMGLCKDLTSDKNPVRVVYSPECKVFSVSGGRRSVCNKLYRYHNARKQRKEKRNFAVHPKCNKRYLSRDELVSQLKTEKASKINAEIREWYWFQ